MNTLDDAAREWLYVQIFLQKDDTTGVTLQELRSSCDELLRSVVPEIVAEAERRNLAQHFFFIRYGEDGYHLRLRFQGQPDDLHGPLLALLEERITAFFKQHSNLLTADEHPVSSAALWQSGRLRKAVYEPELTKYGGPAGIGMAEAHFEVSSKICFQILRAEQKTGIARSQFSLELMQILLAAYGASLVEQAFLLKAYSSYWMQLVDPRLQPNVARSLEDNYQRRKASLHERLHTERGVVERACSTIDPALFTTWRDHVSAHIPQLKQMERQGQLESPLADHVARQDALLQQAPTIRETPTTALLIVTNYLHLINNRLGLSPLHEIQLTYLMYRYIEDQLGIVADECSLVLEPGGTAAQTAIPA